MPEKDDLPSTVQRSPEKAQRTWQKTHDSAVEQYGEGERAHRTAFASLKHSFEKVGDHWERKEGGKRGPSDEQSEKSGAEARENPSPTAGGVDANASKSHLYERASELDVPGRSRMDKDELVEALQKANDKKTAEARERETRPKDDGDRADEPSKQELYDRAQDLGIAGRSSMNKDELARAVDDAER